MFISKKKHKRLLDIYSNQRNMLIVLLRDTNANFKIFPGNCISFETDKHRLFLKLSKHDLCKIYEDQPLGFSQDNYDDEAALRLTYDNKQCMRKLEQVK